MLLVDDSDVSFINTPIPSHLSYNRPIRKRVLPTVGALGEAVMGNTGRAVRPKFITLWV